MTYLSLNVRALRIAYNQFFVDTAEKTDEELVSIHYRFVDDIERNEDSLQSQVSAYETLCILEYLEELRPSVVLDMILDLYSDIVREYGFENPNVVLIDKAEVVEVLAANAVLANGNSVNDPEYQEFLDYYQETIEGLTR